MVRRRDFGIDHDGKRRSNTRGDVGATATVPLFDQNQARRTGTLCPETRGKPWLAEDDETLKTMYEDGATFGQMAERFGRSESAIVSRLVRLRLSLFKQN